jgi:cytoskeletal protein CcmA (bactofilin family)
MIGTTTSAGGNFRNVRLTGESLLSGDVDCYKLSNTGELVVKGNLRAEELSLTGECDVQGSLQTITARGRGEVKVSSGVRGENIKFTGSIGVGGDCEAGSLEVDGAINVAGLLSADRLEIKMYGPCKAKEIGGTNLFVKRSKATRIINLLKSSDHAKLYAEQIEGDKVELDHTEASVVRGNNVKIGPGCEIGRVEYRDTLEIHKSSLVKESIQH